MTTKAELEAYAKGALAIIDGLEKVPAQGVFALVNSIIAMVPDVIASEVAAATPAPTVQITGSDAPLAPVAFDAPVSVVQPVIVQQPEQPASSPYISVPETSPVEEADPIGLDPDQPKRDQINSLIAQLQAIGASYPKADGALVPADQLDATIQQCEDLLAVGMEPATPVIPTAVPDDATAI